MPLPLLLEIELKEEAELQAEPKSLLSLNSSKASVPRSDSTCARLLLLVLALRWGAFQALCTTTKETEVCSRRAADKNIETDNTVCNKLLLSLYLYLYLSLSPSVPSPSVTVHYKHVPPFNTWASAPSVTLHLSLSDR